jgi:hypothetical protein
MEAFEVHILVREGNTVVWRPVRPSGAAEPYRYRTRDCASYCNSHQFVPQGWCIVEVEAEPNMPLMCPRQRRLADPSVRDWWFTPRTTTPEA